MAMSKGQHVELLKIGDFDMAAAFKQDYVDLLKFYYVGGMPEVVRAFADSRDFNEVREIQQRIWRPMSRIFQARPQRSGVSYPNAVEQHSGSADQGEQEVYLRLNQRGSQSEGI